MVLLAARAGGDLRDLARDGALPLVVVLELQLEYNHERQGAITSEITEVSAGARSKKNHMKKEAQHAHR